jgi:ribonucleotide monophosphatase NagD (HAD superfamily)
MPLSQAAYVLDMDGVLYHGEAAIPGALEFMRRIADRPHVFITNNPVLLPAGVADMGREIAGRACGILAA